MRLPLTLSLCLFCLSPAWAGLEIFACEPEWAALARELSLPDAEIFSACGVPTCWSAPAPNWRSAGCRCCCAGHTIPGCRPASRATWRPPATCACAASPSAWTGPRATSTPAATPIYILRVARLPIPTYRHRGAHQTEHRLATPEAVRTVERSSARVASPLPVLGG